MLSCLTGMYGRCVGCLGTHQGFTTHKHANSLNHALFVWNSCCSQSMLMIWLLHNELSWIKQYLNVRNVSVLLRAATVGNQRYETQLRFFLLPRHKQGICLQTKAKKKKNKHISLCSSLGFTSKSWYHSCHSAPCCFLFSTGTGRHI